MLALGAAMAAVFNFSPARYSFYPACPIYALTGWKCPGCGSTRALYELLHLHFQAAYELNALFAISAPVLLAFVVYQYFRVTMTGETQRFVLSPRMSYAAIAVALLFGVGRNLLVA